MSMEASTRPSAAREHPRIPLSGSSAVEELLDKLKDKMENELCWPLSEGSTIGCMSAAVPACSKCSSR